MDDVIDETDKYTDGQLLAIYRQCDSHALRDWFSGYSYSPNDKYLVRIEERYECVGNSSASVFAYNSEKVAIYSDLPRLIAEVKRLQGRLEEEKRWAKISRDSAERAVNAALIEIRLMTPVVNKAIFWEANRYRQHNMVSSSGDLIDAVQAYSAAKGVVRDD